MNLHDTLIAQLQGAGLEKIRDLNHTQHEVIALACKIDSDRSECAEKARYLAYKYEQFALEVGAARTSEFCHASTIAEVTELAARIRAEQDIFFTLLWTAFGDAVAKAVRAARKNA